MHRSHVALLQFSLKAVCLAAALASIVLDCDPVVAQLENTKSWVGIFMTETVGEEGLQITRVVEDSPAERYGIKADDILVSIDGVKVNTTAGAVTKVQKHAPGEKIKMVFMRGGKQLKIKLILGETEEDSTETPTPDDAEEKQIHRSVTFQSGDGLTVNGDIYFHSQWDKSKPFILFCHREDNSRGAFRKIAPDLVALGFNCLAIDQRCGGTTNDVTNLTVQKAIANGKGTTPVDAEQDIIAAAKWVRANHAKGKLIVWGDGYAGSLAIRMAGEKSVSIDKLIATGIKAPFEEHGKPQEWIVASAKKVGVPTLVSLARKDSDQLNAIKDAIPGKLRTAFPDSNLILPTVKEFLLGSK